MDPTQQPQPITPIQPQPQVVAPTQPMPQAMPAQPVVQQYAQPQPMPQALPMQPAAQQYAQPAPQAQMQPQPMPMPAYQAQPGLPPQPQAYPLQQPYQQLQPQYQQPYPPGYPPAGMVPAGSVEERAKKSKRVLAALHAHEFHIRNFIVVFVLGFTIANILFSLHVLNVRQTAYNNLPEVKAKIARKNFGPEVVDRPDGTLDLSHKFNSLYAEHAQDIKAGVKQQINLSDGFSMIITDVQKGWLPNPDGYGSKPGNGNYYIKLHIVAGNRGSEDLYPDFGSIDAKVNGLTISDVNHFVSKSDLSNGEASIQDSFKTIAQGQTQEGAIVIEVPDQSNPTLIITHDGYDFYKDKDTGSSSVKEIMEISL